MSKNRQIVESLLNPQIKALREKRPELERAVDKARANLEDTKRIEAAQREAGKQAWEALRRKARALDTLLAGSAVTTAALLICMGAATLARREGKLAWFVAAVSISAAVATGLHFWTKRKSFTWSAATGALFIVASFLGFRWAGGVAVLAAFAIGAVARLKDPGELSLLDERPREGTVERSREGPLVRMTEGGASAGRATSEILGQRAIVATAASRPLAWFAPQSGVSAMSGKTPWPGGMAKGLLRQDGALAAWVMRDRDKVRRAEKALQEKIDERERAEVRIEALERQLDAWEGVGLPEATLRHLVSAATLISSEDKGAPTGLLLYGPAGSGKTEVGQRIAKAGGMTFIPTSASALKSEHVGGTEKKVADLFEKAKSSRPAVIFVDECDSCLPDRAGSADAFAKSITESFLTHWQGFDGVTGVCVVGATNHRARIDPAIMSRFSDSLEIGLPDAESRAVILQKGFEEAGISEYPPADLVGRTAGMVGRDLMALARNLKREMVAEGKEMVSEEAVNAALAHLRGRGSFKTDNEATWETLVLPEDTLKALKTMTRMMMSFESLKEQGIRVPRGVLLAGPPGTGKTQVARTMANMSGLSFVPLSPADVKAGFVGQTAGLVRAAIERARSQAPSIVFMDEIDILAPSRGTGDAFTQDLIGQLLQELDGALKDDRPIFFLAATNRLDTVDAAILSRFPRTLEIPLPTKEAREAILANLLGTLKHVDGDRGQIAARMAEILTGWSGRDLRSLVEQASVEAFNRAEDPAHVVVTESDLKTVTGNTGSAG